MSTIEHEPDLRGPAVVVQGSFLEGFKITGPFESIFQACDWIEHHTPAGIMNLPSFSSVMLLEEPKSCSLFAGKSAKESIQ